jgi:hypothetical protein
MRGLPKVPPASAPGFLAAFAASVRGSSRVSALMARRREEGLEGRSRRAPRPPWEVAKAPASDALPATGTEGEQRWEASSTDVRRCWPASLDGDLDGEGGRASARSVADPKDPRAADLPPSATPPLRSRGYRPSSSDSAKHLPRSHFRRAWRGPSSGIAGHPRTPGSSTRCCHPLDTYITGYISGNTWSVSVLYSFTGLVRVRPFLCSLLLFVVGSVLSLFHNKASSLGGLTFSPFSRPFAPLFPSLAYRRCASVFSASPACL